MATLNIKNLPEGLYRKLKARARKRHRSVAQEVTNILSEAVAGPEELSILNLKGLGQDRWKGIDPAEHVERERRSWD